MHHQSLITSYEGTAEVTCGSSIGFLIVYLLPEHSHPEVFANELQQIQLVLELGIILGEPLDEPVSGVVAEQLQLGGGRAVGGGHRGVRVDNLTDQLQVQQLEWNLLRGVQVHVSTGASTYTTEGYLL